jgi:hypothetical protein
MEMETEREAFAKEEKGGYGREMEIREGKKELREKQLPQRQANGKYRISTSITGGLPLQERSRKKWERQTPLLPWSLLPSNFRK